MWRELVCCAFELLCGLKTDPADLEACCEAGEAASQQLASQLEAAVASELVQPEQHGLARPQVE